MALTIKDVCNGLHENWLQKYSAILDSDLRLVRVRDYEQRVYCFWVEGYTFITTELIKIPKYTSMVQDLLQAYPEDPFVKTMTCTPDHNAIIAIIGGPIIKSKSADKYDKMLNLIKTSTIGVAPDEYDIIKELKPAPITKPKKIVRKVPKRVKRKRVVPKEITRRITRAMHRETQRSMRSIRPRNTVDILS